MPWLVARRATGRVTSHGVAGGFAARDRGTVAQIGGAGAEARVADRYRAAGFRILHRRWRGAGAEIDLILGRGRLTVFVEVKSAEGLDEAMWRLGPAQRRRILAAAQAYSALCPAQEPGEQRCDLAVVDRAGRIAICENAFWGDDLELAG